MAYDHPGVGVIATHFEGITGAGRAGEYNLVANWVTADGVVHPAVLHVDANGNTTWYEIDIPGDVVSSNSAYGDHVVGIYVQDGQTHGYLATMPAGMYNPIRNETPLVVSADGATGIATNPGGDDVIDNSTILITGTGSVGIRGETYGVITNNDGITAAGAGSVGVRMNGLYGTLLNFGKITAAPGADAIATGPEASGTAIVNAGIIDGRVTVLAGPEGALREQRLARHQRARCRHDQPDRRHVRPDLGGHARPARRRRRQRHAAGDGRGAAGRHRGSRLRDREPEEALHPAHRLGRDHRLVRAADDLRPAGDVRVNARLFAHRRHIERRLGACRAAGQFAKPEGGGRRHRRL